MTGWRIGYACAPNDLISGMLKIHQYSMLSAPTIAQKAVVRALDEGDAEIERMKTEYERRRHIVHRSFNAMGLPCPLPGGAFYAFPDIRPTRLDDVAFCEGLLRAKKVAIVPGSAFGACGAGFVRVALTRSERVLAQAMELVEEYVQSL
jgi:aminotransferase